MSASSRLEVVEKFRQDIVRHRFQPGSRLPVLELCEELGVGLSDLHKMIGELSADRLVTSETQRGVRAATVSRSDLEDLTQTRLDIESLAIRRAIKEATDDSDAQLVGAYYSLSRTQVFDDSENSIFSETYLERHRAFHEALVGGCKSSWLQRFRSLLFLHAERYQQLSVQYRARSSAHRKQHKAIMDAVLDRNADLAAALLSEHISSAAQLLIDHHFGGQAATAR